MVVLVTPLSVLQLISLTMTFWATSASLRVRYPESAVLSAVSARPLRAPWVDEKYSSTDRPSRKLDMIGVSMISPDGLAIRPRMPPSWRIWSCEPRAPEFDIMKIELIWASPPLGFILTAEISVIMSSEMRLVHFDQASTTLLYFSPWVIRPSLYCCSNSLASVRVSSTIFHFDTGTTMSSLPNET